MRAHFTPKSGNLKTGPIPVSVSERKSCPPSCPFIKAICYAEAGFFTRLHWNHVSNGTRGGTWRDLCDSVRELPARQLWRHNVAGDLPGTGESINGAQLRQLARANVGKRGFTYTHKLPCHGNNAKHIADANDGGFTINLSANDLTQADNYVALGIAPVVVVLPSDTVANTVTPSGNKVVVCPATLPGRDTTCATCGLCQRSDRSCIIGFPAHGSAKRAASAIAEGESK